MKLNTIAKLDKNLTNTTEVDFSFAKSLLYIVIQELSTQTQSFEKGKANFNQELLSNFSLSINKILEEVSKTNSSIELIYSQVSNPSSIEAKLAARDLVDIQDILQKIESEMNSVLNSLELDLRLSYYWKFWLTKVAPLQKELNRSFKKFSLLS